MTFATTDTYSSGEFQGDDTKVEPAASIIQEGYVPKTGAGAQHINWLLNDIYKAIASAGGGGPLLTFQSSNNIDALDTAEAWLVETPAGGLVIGTEDGGTDEIRVYRVGSDCFASSLSQVFASKSLTTGHDVGNPIGSPDSDLSTGRIIAPIAGVTIDAKLTRSDDWGVTWTNYGTANFANIATYIVRHWAEKSLWLVGTANGAGNVGIYTSSNGNDGTWTARDTGLTTIHRFLETGGTHAMVVNGDTDASGDILYSTSVDGTTWVDSLFSTSSANTILCSGLVPIGDNFLVFMNDETGTETLVLDYNPATDTWTELTPIPAFFTGGGITWNHFAAAVDGTIIYVTGNTSDFDVVDVYVSTDAGVTFDLHTHLEVDSGAASRVTPHLSSTSRGFGMKITGGGADDYNMSLGILG